MRYLCLTVCLLTGLSLVASPTLGQSIHPGKTGTALEAALRNDFKPTTVLTYSAAKTKMFTTVDNQNGKVTLLYTGDSITVNGVPSPNFANVEHVWPQSRFGSNSGGKKSDLHHLFPTYSKVNSDRGNHPFAEIPDSPQSKWWNGPTFLHGIPGTNIDSYSESANQRFEPREDQKGNVARALFYFRTIYGNQGIEKSFFDGQRSQLLVWHTNDPADQNERARNGRVAATQGNRNPFIDDATLASRAFGPVPGAVPAPAVVAAAPAPAAPAAAALAVGETLADGDTIDVMTWNLRFFFDADISDNSSQLAIDESAGSDTEFAQRVTAIASVINNAGLPEIIALQEIENEKVVQRLANELNSNFQAKYKVGFKQGSDTFTEQDVAFLYEDKPGITVSFQRIPDSNANNVTTHKMPSKHCVMKVSHALADGTKQHLTLINCHLKAGSSNADETQRMKQARVVNSFLRKIVSNDARHAVMVMGDMNAGQSFANTTANDAIGVISGLDTRTALDNLVDLNGTMTSNKRKTHVSNRELDRILLSGALIDDQGLVFEQVVVRRDLVNDESDHFPMVATFTYRTTPGP